ncbi:MAG TPA: outer membrane lipoprotein carrier protein LolA [Clostridia bacterium]|nr:outer membrane lipoprotein carrier protein LolA [Clostridia bacterium]
MNEVERKISAYIDALNAERKPERDLLTSDEELEKLAATVRQVRTLREPEMPDSDYPKRLSEAVTRKMQKKVTPRRTFGRFFKPATVLVAGLLLFALLTSWGGLLQQDVVYAMEKAVAQLENYHGILEMRTKNANGEEWVVRQVELWSEGNKYALRQDDGTLTVNNGEQKWQIRPQSGEVAILPVVPDPTRSSFDLRDEAKRAKEYPHKVVGSEVVAGRQATKLEITPPGGLSYYLWVDNETDLPIQLQTAMQNGLQTTYTFISFKPNTKFEANIFAYQVPEGYKVIAEDPGQLVATVEEAAAISGLTPILPHKAPKRVFAFENKIVLDYEDTTITESLASGSFKPAPNSALGTAAGGPLEVWWESLRWRQTGLEIQVEGPQRVELAQQIAPDLTLPDLDKQGNKGQVKVPVDMEIVKASQQQVDRGSSPWQLDPMQVALTFVNLEVTPEGIVGEPTIPMASFEVESNNGAVAVVKVSEGPIAKVYLERLIRQDETGIWTVVGYDPR